MDSTLERMLRDVPDEYDKSEGGIFYDALAPVAGELTLLEMKANGILNTKLLDTAEGADLDRVVAEEGVARKLAQYAEGEVTFYGDEGTKISTGALVASDAVQYYVKADVVIGNGGSVVAPIICAYPGSVGNVGAGYVTKFPITLAGVNSVKNDNPVTGGYDQETDDELRARTYSKIRTPGTSGNKYDYINWAVEVEGVGGAKVIPLWDGPGTVKVVIVDSNGEIADADTVMAVIDNIEKKRPVGANVTVISAIKREIIVSADIIVKSGYRADLVKAEIEVAIRTYLQTFGLSGAAVSYAKIGAAILNVAGVDDYSSLLINGETVNVEMEADEVPMLGEFTYASKTY